MKFLVEINDDPSPFGWKPAGTAQRLFDDAEPTFGEMGLKVSIVAVGGDTAYVTCWSCVSGRCTLHGKASA